MEEHRDANVQRDKISIDRACTCVTGKSQRGSRLFCDQQIRNLPACILLWTKTCLWASQAVYCWWWGCFHSFCGRGTQEPDRHLLLKQSRHIPLKKKMFVGNTTHWHSGVIISGWQCKSFPSTWFSGRGIKLFFIWKVTVTWKYWQ